MLMIILKLQSLRTLCMHASMLYYEMLTLVTEHSSVVIQLLPSLTNSSIEQIYSKLMTTVKQKA